MLPRGFELFLVYGANGSGADTLQAVQNHAFTSPLSHPGAADLTAHVNFAAVAAALGPRCSPLVDLAAFLLALGYPGRVAKLLASQTDDAAKAQLATRSAKLLDPNDMGRLFKVLCWYTEQLPPPLGFDHQP